MMATGLQRGSRELPLQRLQLRLPQYRQPDRVRGGDVQEEQRLELD